MKTLYSLIALAAAPTVMCSSIFAAEAPKTLSDYLPCEGALRQGTLVQFQMDPSFVKQQQAVAKKYQSLSKEDQKAIEDSNAGDTMMNFSDKLWDSKADYEEYVAAWKKCKPVNVAVAGMRFQSEPNNEWGILAVLAAPQGTQPLSISNLRYNPDKNEWISNNGTLTAKDFKAGEGFAFGAQTGTEWSMSKEDSFSKINEALRISRTTDGKNVYVSYSMREFSAISGQAVANQTYTLCFPVPTAKANTGKFGQR